MITTKGRYRVRLMLDLALHYGRGCVTLKDIAQRHDLSEKYLWKLVNLLKIAGLAISVRGNQGGFALAKPPAEISLKDILIVLEGPLVVDCVNDPLIYKQSKK